LSQQLIHIFTPSPSMFHRMPPRKMQYLFFSSPGTRIQPQRYATSLPHDESRCRTPRPIFGILNGLRFFFPGFTTFSTCGIIPPAALDQRRVANLHPSRSISSMLWERGTADSDASHSATGSSIATGVSVPRASTCTH